MPEDAREERYRQFCWKLMDAAQRTPGASPAKETMVLLEKIVLDKTGSEQRAVLTLVSMLCAYDPNLLSVIGVLSEVLFPVVQMATMVLDEEEARKKK